jgi:UDP-glucose 4-epimerase
MAQSKIIYLITGVAGFIGSHIAEELLKKRDIFVIGIDNFYSGFVENIELLKNINKNNFKFYEIDIRNYQLLEELFQTYKINGIFHLAAIASVQKSIENPIFSHSVNVMGTLNILELSRKYKINKIVFSSSAAVYGDEPTLPKNENSKISPISPYGYEKLTGENYMKLYNKLYGIKTISLRYFNVYGERQDPSSDYSGVISIFLDRISKSQKVNIYGNGNQYRDFIYVKDVVAINLLAMERDEVFNKVFAVGTGKIVTINKLLELVNKKFNCNIKPNFQNSRNGDIKESVCNNSEIQKVLNFNNFTEFKKGIEKL